MLLLCFSSFPAGYTFAQDGAARPGTGASSAPAAAEANSESSSSDFLSREIRWTPSGIPAPWEGCNAEAEQDSPDTFDAQEEFRTGAAVFLKNAREWRAAARRHFEYAYGSERDEIDNRYQVNIDSFEELEGAERKRAIERFRAFIDSHSANENYTPDALFRLGS